LSCRVLVELILELRHTRREQFFMSHKSEAQNVVESLWHLIKVKSIIEIGDFYFDSVKTAGVMGSEDVVKVG
jgi:hypothetical protein